jgi:hypothetical protein
MEIEQKRLLAKILLTLEVNHNGCKQEAVNLLREALGIEIEHNPIREMINTITNLQVESFLESLH